MPTKYKRFRKSKRYKNFEMELYQKLLLNISAIIITIVILFIGMRFFGPKIGSMFGLISIHKDETDPEDTIPPSPPIFSSIPEATNKDKIIINGIAEVGSTVKIFVNGPERQSTIADSEGLFTFVDLELIEGRNRIFAKAIDQKENESENSKTASVTLDTEKPVIEITEPLNGETIRNLNKRINVKGTLSKKAVVHVNGRLAVVKHDNTFEILIGVEEGDMEIIVEAVDEAGNKATNKIFIKYEKRSP